MPSISVRRRLLAAGIAASTVLGGGLVMAAPASAASVGDALHDHPDGGGYAKPALLSGSAAKAKTASALAPDAQIIAYRVFGCAGSTNLVSDAIDRAMDPNGDGDTSDHVDVVNMSLGSDFGAPDDGDAMEANAAADLGVTLAVSMGNSYDVYDVGGSPGAATKAITVAASVDAQSVVDGLTVAFDGTPQSPYPAERSIAYDWGSGDLAGTVAIPQDDPTGCTAFDDADKALIQGKIALLSWHDADPTADGGCGSADRADNVAAAGGVGYIFASDSETFSAGITGDATIPGVLVAQSGGQAIRDAISAGQTVTVTQTEANSVKQTFAGDNDTMTDFSSRGLRGSGDLKPDVTAVGSTVFSALPGSGSGGQTMSGTSMAAPMVAGLAALVKSKHPRWTPAQVKADIMNTADADLTVGGASGTDDTRYAPMRVGSGRIDAATAIHNDVLAAVVGDPGAVSASWGPVQVSGTGTVTRTKTVRLTNASLQDSYSFDVGTDVITTVPGVTYSVSASSVSLEPGASATVTLTLSIDPTTLGKSFDHTKGGYDATTGLDMDPSSGLPQQTIAEASGNLTFTPTGDSSAPALRVPYYSAPRPVATMTQAGNLALGSTGKGSLPLSGTGVDAPGLTPDQPVVSMAQGFELTAKSPAAKACTAAQLSSADGPAMCLTNASDKGSDIKYVGVTSTVGHSTVVDGNGDVVPVDDNGVATEQFAIATYGAHSTPADKDAFVIYLDTDGDGVPDLYTINTHYDSSDVLVSATFDYQTGKNVDVEFLNDYLGEVDTAAYDSDVLTIPVAVSTLRDYGVTSTHPKLRYGIEAVGVQGTDVDEVGLNMSGADPKPLLTADVYKPGITATADGGYSTAVDLTKGEAGYDTSLKVARNAASYRAEGGQGVLVLHYHDAVGHQAQVVTLKGTSKPTLAITPKTVARWKKVTATATVRTVGGIAPTGKVTFRSGSKTLGSATLRSGRATLAIPARTLGRNSVTASYAGDGNYRPATSAAARFTVTTVSRPRVSATPKRVKKGKKVTVVVTVPTVGGVTPTGRITLKVAGRWAGAKALSRGKATFRVRLRKKGRIRVQATYAGNGTYLRATSAVVRVTVHR